MCVTATEPLPGFRDIPPGVHLLWVQPNDFGPRCGYWYIAMDKGAVRVKQWDRFNEVLGEVATQVEVRNQTDNIESTYPTLKPYNMRVYHNEPEIPQWQLANDAGNGGRPSSVATDPYQMWCALTSAITTPFLETVTSKKSVTSWLVNSTDCVKGDSRLPGGHTTASRAYKTSVGSDLDFLFLQDFRDLKVLDNRSTRHLEDDTTDRVLACLGSPESVPDIVAELQFTCLTGIHLANYACMEQWWNLVLKIILRAHKLVLHVPELVQRLLKTLHDQLVYAAVYLEPVALAAGGNDWQIFQIKPQNKSKLRLALAIYKRRLNDTLLDLGHQIQPRQTAVGETFDALEAWLGRNGWDLRNGHPDEADDVTGFDDNEDSDDDDDDLPVVVDVDENGRERGLVSFHRD
ncbi:A1 cistron-splicing factor [Bombardia bombarda]|uniref:A1 cistron-splicing factor n=1 Tax=Bombardia bombarda TaxID=252184 RepID=A0AA39XNW4_9PEZI|nr:A1 cistron-splicing factor [Bombardia bombarda]